MEINKIIITNLPAFYKVNLFNKISDNEKIFVVFTGKTQEMRNADFFKKEHIRFDYEDLTTKSFFYRIAFIFKLIVFSKYKELVLCGWDEFLQWFGNFLSAKKRNSIIVESSIFESETKGIKSTVKKIFLKNISKAYASGSSQIKLLKALGFNGEIKKTKGVGLFNRQPQPSHEKRNAVKDFLYVGRLSPEKNIEQLIEIFNNLPDLNLNIVGFGPQEGLLKSMARENVIFYGEVKNSNLPNYYKKFDVFILPSVIEPWGLVVEEALNNGMPVIVTNRVGCAEEIVKNEFNGMISDLEDNDSLLNSILKITQVDFYNSLKENISQMDFKKIEEEQIQAYFNNGI